MSATQPPMSFDEALALLAKEEEEDRNWRSARSRLSELLDAAKRAKAIYDQLAADEAEKREEIRQIENEIARQKEREHLALQEIRRLEDDIARQKERQRAALEAADQAREERERMAQEQIARLENGIASQKERERAALEAADKARDAMENMRAELRERMARAREAALALLGDES